jgi:hypothetical protein
MILITIGMCGVSSFIIIDIKYIISEQWAVHKLYPSAACLYIMPCISPNSITFIEIMENNKKNILSLIVLSLYIVIFH